MPLSLGCFLVSVLLSCHNPGGSIPVAPWDHIVVVWEENHSASEVADLAYIAQLRAAGLTYSQSFGLARPSQPNYLAFFAGSTMGVTDNLNHELVGDNLYSRFADAGLSMKSYAEGLPVDGFRGASSGQYRRKHNPAASFAAIPDDAILPFSKFPSDFSTLPQLSFVIPDQDNDMHDGTPEQGDQWLKRNLDAYISWAKAHRSLLILGFDEPSTAAGIGLDAPILTVFVGEGISPGAIDTTVIDHYRVSDYVLDCFELDRLSQP